ncbi:MAG: nuclear transport factor 2 family protein [Acidobacteria bacterium]|nr:nuclear transport factor 2 family protein [Acidobacteriota bacterium]
MSTVKTENAIRRRQRQALECCRQFLRHAENRDVRILSLLSPRVTLLGSSPDEVAVGFEAVRSFFLRDFSQVTGPVKLQESLCHAESPSPASATVIFLIALTATINGVPVEVREMRTSFVLSREAGAWSIEHIHNSVPDPRTGVGESLPLREADETRKSLDALVEERTRHLENQVRELEQTNRALLESLDESVRQRGLLPVCAGCKKFRVRDDYWETMEEFLERRTPFKFTHGLCPECVDTFFSGEKANGAARVNGKPDV